MRAIAAAALIAFAAIHPAADVPLFEQHPSCPHAVTEESVGAYPCGWAPWMGNGKAGPGPVNEQ